VKDGLHDEMCGEGKRAAVPVIKFKNNNSQKGFDRVPTKVH